MTSIVPFGYMFINNQAVCKPTSLCTWNSIDSLGEPIPYCEKYPNDAICDDLNSDPNRILMGCYYDDSCGGFNVPSPKIFTPIIPLQPSEGDVRKPTKAPSTDGIKPRIEIKTSLTQDDNTFQFDTFIQKYWWIVALIFILFIGLCVYSLSSLFFSS